MNSLTKSCALLAVATLGAAASVQAAPVWDIQSPSPLPATSELAKEGLAVDNLGNTYAVGYRNSGEAYIERRTPAVGARITASFRPVAADTYFYTGVYVDPAGAYLFVVGTHLNTASGAHEAFVRRLVPATLANYTAGGWGATATKWFPPATLVGAGPKHSFSGRVLANANGLFFSAATEKSLSMVKLVVASGAIGAGWPIGGGQPVNGVRSLLGAGTPVVPMPGSVPGGLFNAVRQSFIEVKGQEIVLAGSLDNGAGNRMDGVLGTCNMAAAGIPVLNVFDNAGQDEIVHALAATTRGLYLAGHTAGAAPASFFHAITLTGAPPPPYTARGPINSTNFDVEARNTPGADDIFVGGQDPAVGGIALHYTNNGAATVPSAAWPNRTYGLPGDVVFDVSFGTVAPNIGALYATGSIWDPVALGRRMAPMKVTAAGLAGVDTTFFAQPISAGNAIVFSPVFSAVFSTGNAKDAGAAFRTENARHNR